MSAPDYLASLNPAQRAAVEHGSLPLLIIAGAGTGKTNTLAHRVAHLIVQGADPRRILLLTFTRRAAEVMIRRAEGIVARVPALAARRARVPWAGTFHAIANRLLRQHARHAGLDPSFTLLDRADSADLLNLARERLGFARTAKRFPQKDTCLAIYSRVVCLTPQGRLTPCPPLRECGEGGRSAGFLVEILERQFPAYLEWASELKALFREYVLAKQERNVLDYDDLLLCWYHLIQSRPSSPLSALAERGTGGEATERGTGGEATERGTGGEATETRLGRDQFDHVLVDEYQDTNPLQAGILLGLKPDGCGLTVVGDDAQAIYSFRAATVRNILDFPTHFTPPARIITLEQNYRSTQPILDAANAVIALAPERFTKNLRATRPAAEQPLLVSVQDDDGQAQYIAERVLEQREAGTALRRQAVLMRAAHHSAALEIELAGRNIPFVKFGGLKFLEAAHVKDVIAVLRWAENPRDEMASFRVLQLLPGLGPALARSVYERFAAAGWDFAALPGLQVPAATRDAWPPLCDLFAALRRAREWQGQIGYVRAWYQVHLERLYDAAPARAADLAQLEQLARGRESRESFLSDLTLDPPSAVGDEAGDPLLDEDYLILSTIHSAKGQEWDAVYVLNVVDGCIPSDMATGTAEEIEEERRLLYVAMTRARDALHLVQPHRFYTGGRAMGDRHVYAPQTRFIPDDVSRWFERRACGSRDHTPPLDGTAIPRVDVKERLRRMWQ